MNPPQREPPASTRDAATLTDAADKGKSAGTRDPGLRGRRRWQRPKEHDSSEEELIRDKEEELGLRHRRREDRHTPEPQDNEERRISEHKVNRAPRYIREVEAPGVHDQNNNDWVSKPDLQMPDSMRKAARSNPATSKDKAEFATGLQIGATEEQTACQMRKEQYKQELLKQIAEQRSNRMREKKLELRVAATGATDPEKMPDRIKEFGGVNGRGDSWRRDVPRGPGTDLDPHPRLEDNKPTENTEQRGKSQVDHGTALAQLAGNAEPGSGMGAAQGFSSLDHFNEDYHRDFSNMLGELAVPRVTGVPPPAPPTITHNYRTPYDEAYYYYGTRNPLDPNLPHYINVLPGWVPQSGNPPQKLPPLRPGRHTEAANQNGVFSLDAGEHPVGRSKPRRESARSYQEALRQQIKEREECKRREKEAKERYDAKIEAEMMAYDPWGRSGGGAPIRDRRGNLLSDLKKMHRINKESYMNPAFRRSGQTQNIRDGDSPGDEARASLSYRPSGFSDQATLQQLHVQETYKEALKQQIEENKRKKAEERERMRIEEEKEERRLAEERTRMQWEYEEEQRTRNRIKLETQSWINEHTTHRRKEEKKVRQEQETEKKEVPESTRGSEENKAQLSCEREPSPPVPALQRRRRNLVASRPSTVLSQLSSRTERSVSAPHYRPVPVETPQPQDRSREVIRMLSDLRRQLRKEQRQLGVRQESHHAPDRPTGLPRVDAFEVALRRAHQPPATRTYPDAPRVNTQNIREFNQLKYRDTASHKEVLDMYPDPPTDAHSLDIQQRALLREQQRKIWLLKREKEESNFSDQQLSHYNPRNNPERLIHRDSLLASESVFTDLIDGGDSCDSERARLQRSPQPSAEDREKTALRRRHHHDISMNQRGRDLQPDARSPQSSTSPIRETEAGTHNQSGVGGPDSHTGEHNSKSGSLSGDEGDDSSARSAPEGRVSVATVATEPWLRPGSSAAAKRSTCNERPDAGWTPHPG